MSLSGISNFITSLISRIDPRFYYEGTFSGPYFGQMILSWLQAFTQEIVSWFYHICKWLLAFVDFLQYFIQKLIGLDYWLNSTSYSLSGAIHNDVLFSFLFDDTVQRVFRAMVGLFFVLLIIFTIVQIIRQEWQYITGEKFGDGKGNSKAAIIKSSLKAIAIVIMFPVIMVVGIISSNAILASLVKALNIDMSSTFGSTLFQISSQNASKYQTYADDNARIPSTDEVVFYTIWTTDDTNREFGKLRNPIYLKIYPGVSDGGHQILNADFKYEDELPVSETVALGVSPSTYFDLLAQYDINLNHPSEKVTSETDVVLNGANYKLKRNIVNSIFSQLYPRDVSSFYGFCVAMDIEDTRHFFMVEAGEDNTQMYHYLHDVLNVPIMSSKHNLGNETLYDDIGGGSLTNCEGVSCFISDLNIHSKGSSGGGYGLDDACYNTWTYSSIYDTSCEFSSGESVASIRNSTAVQQRMGLNSLSSVQLYYNSTNMAQHFDGGQLGNVQLQSEYYVMAEVINFMQTNDVGLYVMNANSSNIIWDYGAYAPESRWISDYAKQLQNNESTQDGTPYRNLSYNCLPFVVSYSDEAPEPGNVLYMSRYGTTSEIYGAKYIMCWKVTVDGKAAYVPLVNGKTFTDPATLKSYRFASDYYNSTYRGVVIAKGAFDTHVSGTDSWRGNPTYLKNVIKSDLSDETSGLIETNAPYYYDMAQTGTISSYATVTQAEMEGRALTDFKVRQIQTVPPEGGTAEQSQQYNAYLVPSVFNYSSSTSLDSKDNYPKQDGFRIAYEMRDSEGQPINFPENTMENIAITLWWQVGTITNIQTARYAGQKTGQVSDSSGNRYVFYLFRTNSEFYFRVAYLTVGEKNYIMLEAASFDDFERTDDIEVEDRIPTIQANMFTYDIHVLYDGVKNTDNTQTYNGEFIERSVWLSDLVNDEGTLYHAPGINVDYHNGDDLEHGETRYENVYFYAPSGSLIDLPTTIEDSTNVNLSIKQPNSDQHYQSYYYTFYLYNFMNGLAYKNDTENPDGNVDKVVKYDDGNISDAPLPTEEGWVFTVKVPGSGFSWEKENLSYNLTNGSTYIATIYKTAEQEVGSHADLRSQTERINYGGNTYYSMYFNDRFESESELKEYYDGMMNNFIIGCYRSDIDVKFLWWDVSSWTHLFTGDMRFYVKFGVPIVERDILSLTFTLENGIKFDYFFEGSTVGIKDLYVVTSIQYWILIIASILIIKVLGKAIWGVIKRFYTITLYFLAMPASASLMPFGGDRFKTNIQNNLIQEILGTYGVILGINVFFILLMPVKSISNIFTQADIETSGSYFLKHLPWGAKILNTYVYILFVLVAFTMIDSLPGVISKMVGGTDAVSEGEKTKKAAGESLQTAAKTWSGQNIVEGVQGAWGMAKQAIPLGKVISGTAGLAKKGAEWAKDKFNKGAGEDEEGEGEGGEGGDGTTGGGEGQSREGEEGEAVEGEGATTVENAADGGAEAPTVDSQIEAQSGLTEEDATSTDSATRAVYEAAESMADMSEEDQAQRDQRSFNQEAVTGGGAADVLGADFNTDEARANAFRNGAGSNAGMTGAAVALANARGKQIGARQANFGGHNALDNLDEKTRMEAYRSTLSEEELKQFDALSNADKTAKLNDVAFKANADGSISVETWGKNGSILETRNASKEASAAMLSAVAQAANVSDITAALSQDAASSSAANAVLTENIAAGIDFSQDTGASARILDIARQDTDIQADALMASFVDPTGKVTDPKMLALLRKSGVAVGTDGTIADRTQFEEFVKSNQEKLMGQVDPAKYSDALKRVVGEKAKSGELKITAWDIQANADSSKLDEFTAQRRAQREALAGHTVLEGTGSAEKAQIVGTIAENLQGTKVGDKVLQVLGRKSVGALSADDMKKLDEAGLTELLARAGTIDRDLTKMSSKTVQSRMSEAERAALEKHNRANEEHVDQYNALVDQRNDKRRKGLAAEIGEKDLQGESLDAILKMTGKKKREDLTEDDLAFAAFLKQQNPNDPNALVDIASRADAADITAQRRAYDATYQKKHKYKPLTDASKLTDREREAAYAEAGITDEMIKAAASGQEVETATRYQPTQAKTAEEIEMEMDMSRELAKQNMAGDAELLANTFANSDIEGKSDIASAAVRSALGDGMSDKERADALKAVMKTTNIQDLKAQGFSEDDIILAQRAMDKGLGGDLMSNLTALRDDPNSMLKTIMAGGDAALKGSIGTYLSTNLNNAQKNGLADLAGGSSFATMNQTQQEAELVRLAKLDGSIMENVPGGDKASDADILAYLQQNKEARAALEKKANETSYLAAQDPSKVNKTALQEAVLVNRQVEASLQADGASIGAEQIRTSISSADSETQQAFIDTYIEKSGIIGDAERLRIRRDAAKAYLAKKNHILNPNTISDEEAAKALDEDAGAMEAADAAVKSTAEDRLKRGLGGRNEFVARAVRGDKKLMKDVEKEFRAQFGTDFSEADALTQQAFLAKFESRLDTDTVAKVNQDYFASIKSRFQTNAKTNKEKNIYNKWLSMLEGEIGSKLTADSVRSGQKSIDEIIAERLTQFGQRNNGVDISLQSTSIMGRLTSDQDAFQSVYDSLSREQGQDGVDVIESAKRNHIKRYLGIKMGPNGQLVKTSLDAMKAGTEIDPSSLSTAERRDYDYNKGVLSKEVLQNGRTDLLKNVFDNVDFVGKDDISKQIAALKAKGMSEDAAFAEVLKTNEALKTKLLNLGAQDMKLTLTEKSLHSREADVVKNTAGLKNDLFAYIKNELSKEKDDAKREKLAASFGIDTTKIDVKDIKNLNSLDEKSFSDLNAAISARKAASSTFAKALSDGVTRDVSYAGHATEEDKQRFFDNQEAEAAAQARKRKYKNISEAFAGFTTTSIVGHAAQSVLFKITKKLPEHSAAYDNYNRKIQQQIHAIEADDSLSRAEKDAQIKQLEAKKVITKLPENWARMSNEEQQAYKKQQEINKRVAFKEGNFSWLAKGGLAIKGAAGNVAAATSNVARAVGVKVGSAFSFLPFARTDGVKTHHKDTMSDISARISRFNAAKSSYRSDVEFGTGFVSLAASYGLDADKLAKRYNFADDANYQRILQKYQDDVKNGRTFYAQTNLKILQDLQKKRQEAIESELNRRYRVASKKVARDEKQDKRSFFDGYGIGEENVRYKEANTKYLQVQSHINTHIPGVTKLVNHIVTKSRLKNVAKVEADPNNASRYAKWRYDHIYGRKTDDSGIKAQNNIVNAQNMIAELQRFNTSYRGTAKDYMQSLFDDFKQKFGENLTKEMLKKLKIGGTAGSNTFQVGFWKSGVLSNHQGTGNYRDFTSYAMSIQTREIEKMLLNQMKQQQRRAMYSSAAIPASSEAAGAFVGKTLTGANTRVQVENDRLNAENLNKIMRQIQAQSGIVRFSALDLQKLLGTGLMEKLQNSKEYKKLGSAADDASRYDLLKSFVKRELEKANDRVANNSFLKDNKYQLQKLNGIYVDRREIKRGSAEAREAFRTQKDPVFERVNRDYHVMRRVVANQRDEYARLNQQLQQLKANSKYKMDEQTKRAIKKLQSQLYDLQNQLNRNQEKLKQTRARYDAKLDSFAAQSLAQRSSSGQSYTINSNAPLDVKINAKISSADRAKLERDIRQAVLERARQDLSAINTRSTLTPEMESKIRSILGSYNFNDKLGRIPGLMSKLQSELESEISRLQDRAHAEVRARTQELLRKLQRSEADYKMKQRSIEKRIKDLETKKPE